MTASTSPKPINSVDAAITALKNSDDSSVRYYAAWWLGKNRILAATSLLCECLKDEEDRTALGGYPLRRQAARSLGMLKEPIAIPPLIEALDCSDSKLQQAVILALKDIGTAKTTVHPRAAIVPALWEVQDKIEPFLRHSSERVKCAAAQYFYTLTLEPHYLEMLFQTLGHENRFVRYAAAFDLSAPGID